MKDINLINYLKKHNIDIPENISVSTVSLPSLINKSEEIKHIKNENKEGTLLNTNNYLKNFIQEELYKCEHQLFKLRENGLLGMMTMKKLDQQFA